MPMNQMKAAQDKCRISNLYKHQSQLNSRNLGAQRNTFTATENDVLAHLRRTNFRSSNLVASGTGD